MKKRIETLKLLISKSRLVGQPETPDILREFDDVLAVNRMMPLRRRCLIQVLHSTRGLDSSLAAFLRARGVVLLASERSLGAYLKRLCNPGVPGMGSIKPSERANWQRRIVDLRNRYMHQAGASPAGINEIERLLSEMQSCLTRSLVL